MLAKACQVRKLLNERFTNERDKSGSPGVVEQVAVNINLVVATLFSFVEYQDGDTAVAGIGRILGDHGERVGVAANFAYLTGMQAGDLHQFTGGIGTVGGEFPIGIAGLAGEIGVGVTFKHQSILQFAEFLRNDHQYNGAFLEQLVGTGLKEGGGVLGFIENNAQTFGGHLDPDVLLEPLEGFLFLEFRENILGSGGEFRLLVLRRERFVFDRIVDEADGWIISIDHLLGSFEHAGTALLVKLAGIAEIAGDRFFHVVFLANQPHHEEKAHHGGHKVGKGDFPGAAVVTAVAMLLSFDYYRLDFVSHGLLLLRFVTGLFQFIEPGADFGIQRASSKLDGNHPRHSFME